MPRKKVVETKSEPVVSKATLVTKIKKNEEPEYFITTCIDVIEKLQFKVNITDVHPDSEGKKQVTFACTAKEAEEILGGK